MKGIFALCAFLAFLAAMFFFGCAVFGQSLGDTNLIADGLFCCAIAFALQSAPAPPTE